DVRHLGGQAGENRLILTLDAHVDGLTTAAAELADGRGGHLGAWNLGAVGAGDLGQVVRCALAVLSVYELDLHRGEARLARTKASTLADGGKDFLDLGPLHHPLLDLRRGGVGSIQRRTGRHLEVDGQGAVVGGREELRGEQARSYQHDAADERGDA